MVQVGVYTFHEFAEAGLLPNSDALHEATEILSPYGLYGKWFSLMIVLACATWLAIAWLIDSRRPALYPERSATASVARSKSL
jgi:hypothetical protein